MKRRSTIAAALLAVALAGPAFAVQPDEVLSNPEHEARARTLSKELRCMVCQNQSIDDSDAPLAKDLRILVRERIEAGDTDRQVLDYLVARYGEFVLYRPQVEPGTWLLWFGPLALLLLGGLVLWRVVRRRGGREVPPADPSQEW